MKFLLTALATFLLFTVLSAQELYTATLSGQQEAFPIASPATGQVTAELNGDQLSVSGSFSGLTGLFDATVAGGSHLHIAPAGSNGNIAFTLTPILDVDLQGGTFSAAANTFTLTPAQIELLRDHQFYVNIHTTIYGGGELRGQLLRDADTHYWANLFGSNEVPAIMTDAAGAVAVTLTGNELVVTGSFADLSSPLAIDIAGGVHLHIGLPGTIGDVAFALAPSLNAEGDGAVFTAADNTFQLTDDQATALAQGSMYVNIHSLNFPVGELRGQLGPIGRAVFRAHLSAANEVPITTSLAGGQVLLTLTEGELIVTGRIDSLESDLATDIVGGIHLHAAAAGRNGDVVIPLNLDVDADLRGGDLHALNNTFELNANLETALLDRRLYVNVHSLDHPGGEIRGQALAECQVALTAYLSGSQEVPDVSTGANGMVKVEISGNRAIASGSFNELSSALDISILGGAHLHAGLPGQTGDVIFPLTSEADLDLLSGVFMPEDNRFTLEAEERAAFLARAMYVNVHSLTNGMGEIRGNLMAEAASYFFSPLSGASETNPVNTSASGMVALEINRDTTVAVGSFAGLSSDLATDILGGAHLHTSFAGGNGDVYVPLTVSGSGAAGEFLAAENRLALGAGALDSIRNRQFYVNVHSVTETSGEIRGQVLPAAEGYFHTTLAGLNEADPFLTTGRGGLKLELVDTTLICTGSFSELAGAFDASIMGGAHLHLGGVGTNGDIDLLLSATTAADDLSGYFAAADNTFALSADQVAALRAGDYYANIHTAAMASGELRGQVLPEINFFPEAGELELPIDGAVIDIVGNALTEFTATWLPADDPDGDEVAYLWQLGLDADFETTLLITNTEAQTFFTTTFGALDELLADNGILVGGSVTLYHRVLVTDGSNTTPGPARSVQLNRGQVTALNELDREAIDLTVYPTVTQSGPVTVGMETKRTFDAQLLVVNSAGRLVHQRSLELRAGQNQQRLDMEQWPAGRYFISVQVGGQWLPAQAVIKQ